MEDVISIYIPKCNTNDIIIVRDASCTKEKVIPLHYISKRKKKWMPRCTYGNSGVRKSLGTLLFAGSLFYFKLKLKCVTKYLKIYLKCKYNIQDMNTIRYKTSVEIDTWNIYKWYQIIFST